MFASLYVPDFPVQASLLAEPAGTRAALTQSPLAILDGPANLPRVFATNSAARRAGIQIGMTKLQVENYGGIELRERSMAAEELGQKALLELAGTFSPRVEATCPGAVILDLAGTERLFGPRKHCVQIITAKANVAGFDVRVAIAENPDTALLAARGFSVNTIIPAGEEARCLARLRVDLLPISPQMLDVLEGWGIRTFQSFGALPAIAVAERLGQEGLQLQKLARGAVDRPLLPVESPVEFVESYEFDDPVETLESLFFILNRLLEQLCSKLIAVSLATNELRLTIGLEVRQVRNGDDGEKYQHTWKLPVPTQDRKMLFGLVRLHLERTTLSAPIRKLAVELIPIRPRVAQGHLFAPPSPQPEQLAITLERICGVVGGTDENGVRCVGSPRLLDTHRPDSFTVEPFSSDSTPPRSYPAVASISALRIFRPAIATSVEVDGEKPHFVWLWRQHRRVLATSGPWSSSGDWWNHSVWTRQEWDVLLRLPEGVGLYRIYHDRIRRQWFVEGVFD
jgi:protein ImuB